MIALLAATSTTVITEAKNNSEKVRFRALAVGTCLVGYGEPYPLWPDCSTGWCGLGKGSVWIRGRAEVEWREDLRAWYSDSVRVIAFISVRWIEEDGSNHRLMVVLYSQENTEGVFLDESDDFAIPLPGESPPDITEEKYLRYRGIYIKDSKIRRIEGLANIFSSALPPVAPPMINIYLSWEGSYERVFAVSWLSEEFTVPPEAETLPHITIPAARIFQRDVKLINSA